jgi:hypothetical protein
LWVPPILVDPAGGPERDAILERGRSELRAALHAAGKRRMPAPRCDA